MYFNIDDSFYIKISYMPNVVYMYYICHESGLGDVMTYT